MRRVALVLGLALAAVTAPPALGAGNPDYEGNPRAACPGTGLSEHAVLHEVPVGPGPAREDIIALGFRSPGELASLFARIDADTHEECEAVLEEIIESRQQ